MTFLKRALGIGVMPLLVLTMLLARAAPVAAAESTACGTLSAYTAPTAATDGSMTFNGETTTIPAGTDVDAATSAALTALATADATTCLTIETDDSTGEVTGVSFAASGQICGTVDTNADGDMTVDGTTVPDDALSAGSSGALTAAAEAGAEACVTLSTDTDLGSGTLGTVVEATVTATLCATVDAVDGDSITLSGTEIPLAPGADVDSAVTAGAEMGLELTADSDGLNTVAVVSLTDCGTDTNAGTGNNTAGNDDGDNPAGGVADDTSDAGVDALPDTALAVAHGMNPMLLAGWLLLALGGAMLWLRGGRTA